VSQAASQAAAFYRQSVENEAVWTVRDDNGYPASKNHEGRRAQPFWSSRSRVKRTIKNAPAYSGFEPEEIPLNAFLDKWVPALEAEGLLVGVNWSAPRATGYDLEPQAVKARSRQPHIAPNLRSCLAAVALVLLPRDGECPRPVLLMHRRNLGHRDGFQ
jgi:hypothetical protein